MADHWAIHHPNGSVEDAGILGEQRARMVARRGGGAILGPYTTQELHRLIELDTRPWRNDPHMFTDAERAEFWELLGRREVPR